MDSLNGSLSFDRMAELYDETRIIDPDCFQFALDYLAERFPPQIFREVIEPGIGTGKIAIPFARRGYAVTGADISREMLKILQAKLRESSLPIVFQEGDAAQLPFADAMFDMGLAVHLFYFIQNWKKAFDELLRVVKAEGPIILMHTGYGKEIPLLNERYRSLCAESGILCDSLGVKSTKAVTDYAMALGRKVEFVQDRWQWTAHTRLDDALSYLRNRAYSYSAPVPDEVHAEVMEKLNLEMQDKFGGLSQVIDVPTQIYLVIITREANLL
jgi:ubiquinone/menaquinone biosynthesis C-methylase UbiE